MIEIGLCADENFAMPCGVCITSIFESNRKQDFRIHILTNGFSLETVSRLEQVASKYNQIICIYKINSCDIDSLPINMDGYSTMTYARFFFPSILSKDINKLIYLDCDIIVSGDIVELWNIDITKYALGAVPDLNADNINVHNRIEVYNHSYVNAGVLIFNLFEWRKTNLSLKCLDFLNSYPEKCLFQDQDAINAVLSDCIYLIDFKFNLLTGYVRKPSDVWGIHRRYWKSVNAAIKKPTIIHYTASVKPWHKEFKHPIGQHFLRIKKLSLWADYKHTRRYKGISRLTRHITLDNLRKVKKFLDL